ncbi:MAG: hypothetical protein V4671_20010 [Armatimonadota bacterium]
MSFLALHIDWSLILSGVATVGIPTALLLYSVKRMRDLAGPHVELEPQHLVNVVLAFPTTDESLRSLEFIVRRADFRSPQTRRDELRKLKSWLADQDLSAGDGYAVVLPPPEKSAGPTGPAAQSLAEAQIKRLETPAAMPRPASTRAESSWCVLGLVAALAASAAEKLTEGDGAPSACQSHDALTAAADVGAAMDAFYLFYSPAPQERLSRDQARKITSDLRALVPNTL